MNLFRCIRAGQFALTACAAALLFACTTTQPADHGRSRDLDFAAGCYARARSNVLVRFHADAPLNGMSFIGTNQEYVTSWPVPVSDTVLVAACERLFLDTYHGLPAKEQERLVPMLVTFGTPATWTCAKTELTNAAYGVRREVVDQLLGEVLMNHPPQGKIIDTTMQFPLAPILISCGSDEVLPFNVRRSRDEVAGLLAERLLNDIEPQSILVVDRIPFIPFFEQRRTIVTTLSEHIATEIIDFEVKHPALDTAIAEIKRNAAHPAYQMFAPATTNSQAPPSCR